MGAVRRRLTGLLCLRSLCGVRYEALGAALLAAVGVSTLAAPAQAQDDAVSAGCRRVRASAESQAFLLAAPILWVEGVHVPRVGDESGMGLIGGTDAYQLRAALSWSPIDLARAVLMLEQAGAECDALDAAAVIQRFVEGGDSLGELPARRRERDVLESARTDIDTILAHASAQLDGGVGTRQDLSELEAESLRLERRAAQLDGEIAQMIEAGQDELDLVGALRELARYEGRTMDAEEQRSSMRRLSPWLVSVRGGILPGGIAGAQTDWFGQIQVGLNLGIVGHHLAEDAYVEARRDELLGDATELRGHVHRMAGRLRAGMDGLRSELGHLDRMIELQRAQRERLAGLESADVEHTRALIDLVLVGLMADRAHLETLIATRESALDAVDHVDE